MGPINCAFMFDLEGSHSLLFAPSAVTDANLIILRHYVRKNEMWNRIIGCGIICRARFLWPRSRYRSLGEEVRSIATYIHIRIRFCAIDIKRFSLDPRLRLQCPAGCWRCWCGWRWGCRCFAARFSVTNILLLDALPGRPLHVYARLSCPYHLVAVSILAVPFRRRNINNC